MGLRFLGFFVALPLVAGCSSGGSVTPQGDASTQDRAPIAAKCVGPAPMEREAGPFVVDGGDAGDPLDGGVADAGCSTCPGTASPEWALADFNPQSCGFKKTYGIDSFRGRPTLVALLAGWCGFCQQQARLLEKLRFELEKENVPVYTLSVNAVSAIDNQQNLVAQCSFPLFQDKPEHDVWGLLKGAKDDFYIYDAKGNLRTFFSVGKGTPSNDLSTPEGYAAVKKALVDASK